MEDTKKRDRSITKDDEESGDSGSGTATGTSSTIPKKRGRPANPNKVKKPVVSSGRGRGRPPKKTSGTIVAKKNMADNSDDDAAANGKAAVVVPAGRGRPPKQGAKKIKHLIEATGKGRGRPKNPPKSDVDDDDQEDGDDANDYKPSAKVGRGKEKSPKKLGRPKKVNSDDDEEDGSDDDDEDNDEEAPPIGRPSTGAVNLNISRTGRGLGRPKKATALKRAAEDATESKKRGRPSSGKNAYVATGKPRGRPKATVSVAESQEDDDDEDDGSAEENEKEVEKKKETVDKNNDDEDDEDEEVVDVSNGEDEEDDDLAKDLAAA